MHLKQEASPFQNTNRPLLKSLAAVLAAAAILAFSAIAQTPAPPADLTALERQVSLKIAHVRIKGPTTAADFKQLGLAQRAQLDGEQAIAAGDYKKAEQDFLRANVLISAVHE